MSQSKSSVRVPGRLVDAGWLASHIGAADLVVLDATVPYGPGGPDGELGQARWEDAHIPGSRYADLQRSLSDAQAPDHVDPVRSEPQANPTSTAIS